ncbi:MAG: T9SS type A sorting domain-containing protein, partial [Flavobacteriales bacterium]|nr:T9SS type A sorting domain-containing protein [Flavobacteriales bacterium]
NVRYKLTTSSTWTNATSTGTSYTASGLTTCSAYEWQVQNVCSGGTSAFTASTSFTTTGCTATCNANYEENDVSTQAYPIAVNTNYGSYICPAYDDDWFSFSNTSSQRNIKVTLTSVPADYDIFLYNPSGVLVGSSENAGTSNETIIYNNGPVGTYKVKVIGYAGATNGTDSYILKAARRSTPYRLDGTDMDQGGDIELTQVYPNPTSDKVNLVFVSAEMAEVQIMVYDMIGQLIEVSRFTCDEGENTTSVNFAHLATGCYTVVLRTGTGSATTRVCKE